MELLLQKLKSHHPAIEFVPGSRFSWSPVKNQVVYKVPDDKLDKVSVWSLLHELAHALLGHNNFSSDFELLSLEAQAWSKANELAKKYGHTIDDDHIQDCLDTYRDWLYARSSCPFCSSCSLQTDSKTYACFNCGGSWQVSASRLCRAYRKKQKEALV